MSAEKTAVADRRYSFGRHYILQTSVMSRSGKGVFITLEGIDGTGKTVQHRLLVSHLRREGYRVSATREPGGTRLGERIRRLILSGRSHHPPDPLTELALMYAARAQLLSEVIRPALARGDVVVSDRFSDASRAYQGYGRGIDLRILQTLERIVCGNTRPDLTIILDMDPRLALGRAKWRHQRQRAAPSRFEAEGWRFQKRVRAGYLAIARQEPGRVKVLRADLPIPKVREEIRKLVGDFLAQRYRGS